MEGEGRVPSMHPCLCSVAGACLVPAFLAFNGGARLSPSFFLFAGPLPLRSVAEVVSDDWGAVSRVRVCLAPDGSWEWMPSTRVWSFPPTAPANAGASTSSSGGRPSSRSSAALPLLAQDSPKARDDSGGPAGAGSGAGAGAASGSTASRPLDEAEMAAAVGDVLRKVR
jgi:hypothetical protein